jgi:hypothetical protein
MAKLITILIEDDDEANWLAEEFRNSGDISVTVNDEPVHGQVVQVDNA